MAPDPEVIPADPDARQGPLSAQLRALLGSDRGQRPTIGEFLDELADDGVAVVLSTLALPALIPVFPPGTAVVIGVVFALVGARMLAGATGLWVPARWRGRPLPDGFAAALLTRGVPIAERLERVQAPPLRTTGWLVRAAGIVPLLMGLIMIAPFPGLNTLPALIVLVLAVGLVRDDALFVGGALVAGLGLVAAMGLGLRFLVDNLEPFATWLWTLLGRAR